MVKEFDKKNMQLIVIGIGLLTAILLISGYYLFKTLVMTNNKTNPEKEVVNENQKSDYNMKIIKEINSNEKGNYLISPYSIEIALSMLKDGASGQTKKEIENLIGNRKINFLEAKEKVNVANGIFINSNDKDSVRTSYVDDIKLKYNSDIFYDELKDAKVINDWVSKKTYNMIPEMFKELPPRTLMILANALAMDAEWKYKFECEKTNKREFIKNDGTKINVAMMTKLYNNEKVKYFEADTAKGVILPYKSYDSNGQEVKRGGVALEFVGIVPNGNVEDYVNNLTTKDLNNINDIAKTTSDQNELYLELPRFTYNYEVKNFKKTLQNLGIKDAFNENADLSRMVNSPSHVSAAVHKTHIDVTEDGTKAAAATAIVISKNIAGETKQTRIIFDKPFVYIIRDKNTKEMLFFGVVYEPNKWKGSTCK